MTALTDTAARWPIAALEKELDATSVSDLCTALNITRGDVFRMRKNGLIDTEAVEMADKAGLAPGEVWPDWQPPAPPAVNVVWEEPPPKTRNGRQFLPPDIVAALQASPGRWARVREYPTKSSADTARKRVVAGVLGDGWEAEQRRTPTGSVLYIRYIGSTS